MPKPGQDHHNARLTDAQVIDMRHKRESKPWLWSYRALADFFGCGESTARDIVCRYTRFNV